MSMFEPDRNNKRIESIVIEIQEKFSSVYPHCDELWKVDAIDPQGLKITTIVQAPFEDAVETLIRNCGFFPMVIQAHDIPNN